MDKYPKIRNTTFTREASRSMVTSSVILNSGYSKLKKCLGEEAERDNFASIRVDGIAAET
jgi:hypothetical protein